MTRRKSYTPAERRKLGAHIAQERVARLLMAACGLGGLGGAIWHGLPSILLGGLGVAFFSLARPGPDETLDDWTGRGR